jgi:riboflavin synthase
VAVVFSGIVEELGRIRSIEQSGESIHLQVDAELVLGDLALGHSVSVDGVCLTVTELHPGGFVVGLSPETLRRSTVGERRAGDAVNLERALQVGARMGGHYVQGHVDGVGQILERRPEGDSEIVTFSAPDALMPYIVMKGFVAIDGISLTVAGRTPTSFSVALVDFTRGATVLGSKPAGSSVNLEVDVIAKYVESLLEGRFARQAE